MKRNVGADCVGVNAALPLSVPVLVSAAVASPTRPLDTDVTNLHVPSALQDRATGQRRIIAK